MTSMTAVEASSAAESINRSLIDLCVADELFAWENPRKFSGYAKRLQLVLNQLLRSSSPNFIPAPPVQTALKGIDGDLRKAALTVSVYKRSKIFVLINCRSLCESLQEHAIGISGWLALLESAVHDHGAPDLRKKVADLSRDMKQAQFRVTENEERVRCTLEKEGQGREISKAVQSAIIMDVARAIGIEPDNHAELSEQVRLLKNDVASSNLVSDKRILMSLERIMANWSSAPNISAQNLDKNVLISPYISPAPM